MYLIYNKILVSRSSSEIVFFKLIIDELNGERLWFHYHTIPIRGFIYFMKGNSRVQIIDDLKIYFYSINNETLEP